MLLLSPIVFLTGALAGRCRGGLLKDIVWLPEWVKTTQVGRAMWAIAVMALFVICTHQWLYSYLVGVFAFVGTLHGYLGGYFGIGEKQNKNWHNYAWLTLASFLRLLPLAVIFYPTPYGIAFDYGVAASLLFVPCYFFGIPMARHFTIFSYTQWGEFFIYGSILTAIYWGL